MKTKKHKVEIPEGYEVDQQYNSENKPCDRLSTTVVFKPTKKPLPKTWEEYCNMYGYPPSWMVDSGVPERYKALAKLELLRDVYNDGQAIQRKCGLTKHDETKEIIMTFHHLGPLEFNNTYIANEFLKRFYSLLEIAKPLL